MDIDTASIQITNHEIADNIKHAKTLESEIKLFVNELPYWAKYLAEILLTNNIFLNSDIDTTFSYLLENLNLIEATNKPDIELNFNSTDVINYKTDLNFIKLEDVEGVNALIENQSIEFSPNMTIIYGENGSGKSGYVRLLKNVFYSKSPEIILPNIHVDSEHKQVNAKFIFRSNNMDITLFYHNKEKTEFKQFSVFDEKSVITHLENKNEFEFRPAALSFFSSFTDAVNHVEDKLNTIIIEKQSGNSVFDFIDLFEGHSEIKMIVQNLTYQTNIDDLKKYTPFSNEDKIKKEDVQNQYDNLLLASKSKEKEIQKLEDINNLIYKNKELIEKLNILFTRDYLQRINKEINDCIEKISIAKNEGIEYFKTDKIKEIGSLEWKDFIIAADLFAKKQESENDTYPKKDDFCLFCRQPLSEDAKILITKYRLYIRSIAEQNAKQAQEVLDNKRKEYEELNFDLFLDENILTIWLNENYLQELHNLKQNISEQKTLSDKIIHNIRNKIVDNLTEKQVSSKCLSMIEIDNIELVKNIKNDEQFKQLDKLLEAKTFLEHKEKFNIHFLKFENYVNNQIWVEKAKKENFSTLKRKITETEKCLSEIYFNQRYVNSFNEECRKLNGNFGIEIKHTGSGGKSYRQLKLKGKNPYDILSEGEQKIIALSDFLAEMNLSEVNRGIVFDDPVNSLDDKRKAEISSRLVEESSKKQIIIFTHDLIFLSNLLIKCEEKKIVSCCHWIENINNNPGHIWLNNTPSYEKKYRNAEPVREYYNKCNKDSCSPMLREQLIKQGFAALRTCYEVLVINDLFNNVVQRYNERVSIDSLSNVCFDKDILNELSDNFSHCCRFMEGHSHSDKYAYIKPELINLNEEIQKYETIRKKIKDFKTKK